MSESEAQATPKKAVILGGAGFLGRRLTALLVGNHAEAKGESWPRFDHVHVVDVAPFVEDDEIRRAREASGTKLTSSVGDVRSLDDLRAAIRGAHTVFHLASVVHVGLSKSPLIEQVNVVGTRNVVQACEELGVAVLVYTSSEDVVLSPTPVAFGDETIPYPSVVVHDYVRTKIEGEKAVLAADRRGGLRTCAIRPVHLYGPHDPHAIKVSLRELASGKVPFLLGDGSARFDIVYVDNVAHAHLLAARKLADAKTRDVVGGQAYFVGEGNAVNYFDFLRPYAAAKGVRMPRLRVPRLPLYGVALAMEWVHRIFGVDVPFHRFHLYVIGQDFFFSHAKAERDLGYAPIVSPAEGERRTVAWIANESL